MLNLLKQYTSSWAAQILIAILVISFAVWGVSDIFAGFGQNSVARVGNTEVPAIEFQRRLDAAARNLALRLGQTPTSEMLVQTGIADQVLSQLITEATLTDAADRLGMALSNATVSRMIRTDPNLAGPTGVYDRETARQIIASMGMTEDEFVVNRRAAYVRNQLLEALGGGIGAPDAYLRAAHELLSQERTISYVVVTGPEIGDIAEPTDTDLAAYYDSHRSQYRAPEYRALSYFELSPAEIADPSEVTDETAQERYDQQITRFTIPETRSVEQIVFPTRDEADEAAEALASGKVYDELIIDRGLTTADVDLGSVTRNEIVDPAVADAAFALTEVGVTPVIDGRFGFVIARVTSIEPAVVTSFDDAKDDIKMEIALQRASDQILDLYNAIEDTRAGGATLAEAAARFELEMTTVPAVDLSGKDPDGNAADIPSDVVQEAFQSDVGLENSPVEQDRASYVWYEVTAITPPRDIPLDEIRDRVTTEWKTAEQQKKLAADATAVKDRLDGGESLADAAAALTLEVATSDAVTRQTEPSGDLSASAIAAAFVGPEGHTAVAPGPQPNTQLVLVVDAVTTPPYDPENDDVASVKDELSSQLVNDILSQYVLQARNSGQVHITEPVIRAIIDAIGA